LIGAEEKQEPEKQIDNYLEATVHPLKRLFPL